MYVTGACTQRLLFVSTHPPSFLWPGCSGMTNFVLSQPPCCKVCLTINPLWGWGRGWGGVLPLFKKKSEGWDSFQCDLAGLAQTPRVWQWAVCFRHIYVECNFWKMLPRDNYHHKIEGVTTSKLFCNIHVTSPTGMGSIPWGPRGGICCNLRHHRGHQATRFKNKPKPKQKNMWHFPVG